MAQFDISVPFSFVSVHEQDRIFLHLFSIFKMGTFHLLTLL